MQFFNLILYHKQWEDFSVLDSRFLSTPGFAIEQCRSLTYKMAEISKGAMIRAMKLLENYNKEEVGEVEKLENLVDKYDDKLGAYLVQLNSKDLSYAESQSVSTLLHTISDLERIADHAVNVMELARKKHKKERKQYVNYHQSDSKTKSGKAADKSRMDPPHPKPG